jgi:RND family efflux transporter MFP subunit
MDSTDYQAGVQQAEAGLQMAEASKRANNIQAEAYRAAYERTKKLYEAGAASSQQLEQAQTQYEALTAGTADASVAQARAGLMAAQTQMDKCILTSPMNGVVGTISVSLGDMVSMQSPAAIVTDVSELEVQVMVSESDVSYIKPASSVDVMVTEVNDKPFKGVVESISTVADPTKRSYLVKVSLPNEESKIKSGMFAEVKIATESKAGVLCVPVSAVMPKNGNTIVFTVDKSKRSRSIKVETGIKNNRYIEITKGLQEDQEVIVKGNTLVNDGTLVRVVTGGAK